MKQPITGYKLDEEGDWIATLACGHQQHIRHKPPFFNRPWAVTEEGRAAWLGRSLDCLYCKELRIPEHFIVFKTSPLFSEATLPEALQKEHQLGVGVWGKINVKEGKLRYHAHETVSELSLEKPGIIMPVAKHFVEPVGKVLFSIEFYRGP